MIVGFLVATALVAIVTVDGQAPEGPLRVVSFATALVAGVPAGATGLWQGVEGGAQGRRIAFYSAIAGPLVVALLGAVGGLVSTGAAAAAWASGAGVAAGCGAALGAWLVGRRLRWITMGTR